jgi:hypothetical protein
VRNWSCAAGAAAPVLERRWTIDEYEEWLACTLIQQLLATEFTEPSD